MNEPKRPQQQPVRALVGAQGSAEAPQATAAVLADWLRDEGRHGGALRLFRGMSLAPAEVIPEHPSIRVASSGVLGGNLAIWKRGQLDLVPEAVSGFPGRIRSGLLGCDTVIVKAALTGDGFRVGTVSDYVPAALEVAERVVVETCEQMPVLEGAPEIPRARVDRVVAGGRTPLELDAGRELPEDAVVGEHVARLVQDGDCIEIGVGGLGRAIARALAATRRDLSVHTGLVNDDVLALIDSGAVSNAGNMLTPGRTTTPVAMGSADFYRRIAGRRDIVLRPVDVTNDAQTIGAIDRFVAINSALEVDLLGQVNAETAGGRRIGAPGGQLDFVTGARLSPGGRSIAVLRATARRGTVSRIVPTLASSVVTVPAGVLDFVVTEFGVADLRGATTAERAQRIAALAAPQFRGELLARWDHDPRIVSLAPSGPS
jgi:acyl-CoA hydrolase